MANTTDYVVTVVHGESASLFHVIDSTAPEGEQPAIVSTHHTREEAEEERSLLGRIAEARERGEEAGKNAASWVFDGNTNAEHYRLTLQQIEDGDPEFYESYSYEPLSGEYAGESIPELIGDLLEPDTTEDGEERFAIMEAYEEAAQDAYYAELERIARFHVEG